MSHNLTYKKFGDVASFSRGLTFAKGDVAIGSSKKVLRSNNIDLQTHTLNFDDVACLKEEFIIPNEKKLHKGDIFICMSNGSTQHLGKVAFIDKDMDYAFGGFMGVIHPDNTTIYPKYAFYACLSSEYRRFLASIFNGININNLKWSDLSNLQIPIPTLQEQERIVAELDLLTGIIDKQKQQLKELDTLAKSIFYDMFGNPVDNEKGWKTCRLESIIQVKGRVGWKGYKKEDLRDSGALAIGGGHLTNSGEIDLSEPVYLSMEKYEESPEIMIETGDLILVQRGTIGKVGLVRTDIGQATINPCVLILRPKTINNVYALHFFLNSNMQEHLKTLIRGVAQPMITQQQVNSLCVPIPPSEQQEVFAQRVQAIESQKQSINRSLAESQKLFDYTMDKYFG